MEKTENLYFEELEDVGVAGFGIVFTVLKAFVSVVIT